MANKGRQDGLQKSLNRVIAQRVELLEKENDQNTALVRSSAALTAVNSREAMSYRDITRRASEAVDAKKKHIAQIMRATRENSKLVETVKEGSSYLKQQALILVRDWVPGITAGALAMKSLNTATNATSTATRRWLSTGQRLDNMSSSYQKIVDRGMEVIKVNQDNTRVAYEYGKSVEYVKNVSDKWLGTLKFTDITDANRESLNKLTRMTVLYADTLGIDASALQEKAATRMKQYGGTAEDAVTHLAKLHYQVISTNRELSEYFGESKAHIFPDDIIPVIERVASSTRGYASDIDTLSAAMAYSAEQAMKAGATYNQSLDAAEAFGKFITGDGVDEAFKTRIGYSQLQQLNQGGDAFTGQFDDNTQKQLKMIMERKKRGEADIFLAKQIQEVLATTEVGVAAMVGQHRKAGGGRSMHLLQGMSPGDAALVSDLINGGGSDADVAKAIMQRKGGAAGSLSADSQADQERRTRALGGKDMVAGALTGVDPQLMADKAMGEVAAQAEDPRVTGGIAAALGLGSAAKWLLGGRGSDKASDQEAIDAAMGGSSSGGYGYSAGASQAGSSLEESMVRALSYYAEGNALRVHGALTGETKSWITRGMEMMTFQAGMALTLTKIFSMLGVVGGGTAVAAGGAATAGAAGAAATGAAGAAGATGIGGTIMGLGGAALGGIAAIGGSALFGAGALVKGVAEAYDQTDMEKLRTVWRMNNRNAIDPSDMDPQAYEKYVGLLAADIDQARSLASEGVINNAFMKDVEKKYDSTMAPPAAPAAIAPASKSSTAPSSTSGQSNAPSSLLARVSGINSASGDVTLTIINGLGIPAAYDRAKSQSN